MMTTLAWLGAGAMGAKMVERLLGAGHTVHVYNRTAAAVAPLVKLGAIQASSAREAASAATVVFSMVSTDEASQQVWFNDKDGAIHGMKAGDIAIESSTLTPEYTKRWATRLKKKGSSVLSAPVAGSTPQAEAGALIYFVGGDEGAFSKIEPVLLRMGQVIHRMNTVEDAATIKLMVNGIFAAQVNILGEMLGLARASGMGMTRAVEILNTLPVTAPALKGIAGLITSDFRASLFPIRLVEKDMRYLIDAATTHELTAKGIEATRAQYDEAISAGLGEANINAVATIHLKAQQT